MLAAVLAGCNDPIAAPRILDLAADPGTIAQGDAATLSWSVAGAAGTAARLEPEVGPVPLDHSVAVAPDRTTTYTLAAFHGTTTVRRSLTVTVVPGNAAPSAQGQRLTVSEDGRLAIVLTGSDPDGDTLSYRVEDAPHHGSLSGDAPELTYTPNADYTGSDGFTFTVGDGVETSVAATVAITVVEVNDAPTATDQTLTVQEDGELSIVLAGSDPEGASLIYTVVDGPEHGALTGASPTLTYTPEANYFGSDGFTFTVSDGEETSPPATIEITVVAENDAPTANGQWLATDEDAVVTVALTGADPEGAPLTYHVVTPPRHGGLTGAAPDLVYAPNADFHGPDSFTFTVADGEHASSPATVEIDVVAVNDAPTVDIVLPEDGRSYTEGDIVTFSATASDVEDGDLSAAIRWESDLDGEFGTGASVSTGTLSIGHHAVVAEIVDTGGILARRTVSVEITGALLWGRQFGTEGWDQVRGVGASSDGSVVVAGRTDGDLDGAGPGTHAGSEDGFVRRIAADGTDLWTRQFGTTVADGAASIAVAGDGSIVVVGNTDGDVDGAGSGVHAGGTDALIRKYAADGSEVWTRQFGASGSDILLDVAVAADGSVLVAGYTDGDLDGAGPSVHAGEEDVFIRKYAADGREAWTRQFGSPNYDFGNGVAVANDGSVFVTGYTYGDVDGAGPEIELGAGDAFIRKFDAAGTELWTRQFGGDGSDLAFAVAATGAGGAVVTGFTDADFDGPGPEEYLGSWDVFVRTFDANGNDRWSRQFGSEGSDLAFDVVVDDEGGIVIAGHATGDFADARPEVHAGSTDGYIRKYDREGIERWTRHFGGSASEFVNGVAIAGDGSVFVGGRTEGDLGATNAGGPDAFVRKYLP